MNNHAHHVMQTLYDGAGIYTVSMNRNSVINGNCVHDNPGYIDKKRGRGGFPGGIYLDEASGGFEVTQNVVYNVGKPYNYNDMGYTGFHWAEREMTNNIHENYFGILPDCEKKPNLCREYNRLKSTNLYGVSPESENFLTHIIDNAGLEEGYKNLLDM